MRVLIALLVLYQAKVAESNDEIRQAAHVFPQNETQLVRRDDLPALTTCGYLSGNADKFRTANEGYNCRFDKQNGLWGFCPDTVIRPIDCGLAGACVDEHDCADGCGKTDETELTTFTCPSNKYYSTALLTVGGDEYAYVACGGVATTDHFFTSPTPKAKPSETETPVTQTSTAEPKSTPASTTPGATGVETTNSVPGTTPKTEAATSGTKSSRSGPASVPSVVASSVRENLVSPESSAASKDEAGGGTAKSGDTTAAIIGGVIGGIAMLCIFGLAAIYLLRRGRESKAKQEQQEKQAYAIQTQWQEPEKNASNRYTGGWGPRELAASNAEPVELPGSYGTR